MGACRWAIQFVELSPGVWGVGGMAELQFSQMEAESTLLWFQEGDDSAAVLAQYNPWTIDMLPAVDGGIYSDALVRPGSESEVQHHRERLAGSTKSIKVLLERVGKKTDDAQLPKINGRIYADLDFLARRLEFGLGGFDRTPHWGTAETDLDGIVKDPNLARAVDRALGDKEPPTGAAGPA